MSFHATVRSLRVLLAIACFAAAAVATNAPTIAARPITYAITLDGRLDEPEWQAAPVVHLVQQSPRPGAPSAYDTEVRVLVMPDRLYVGFVCHDPEPRRIAVHSLQRDSDVSGDDSVAIVLDTYGDRRTGYFFQANAAGARSDGLIAGPDDLSLDWDGVWDVRTQRTADGWSAEFVIPSRTLSFARHEQWGVNFQRFVPRERTTLVWSSPTLDMKFPDMSRAGTLNGVGDLQQGRGLEFSPYATGRTQTAFVAPRAWQGAIGGDVTWKISPQMVTVLTVNTDFAETEVDSRQINLTRFPLFFPEKRAFFLEGANQYSFGLGLGEQFIPFFSRRIGLLNGEQIPIDAGLKLNGRVGRLNIAALDVETRATQTSTQRIPETNLFVTRLSYDVTDKLRVGTLVTNGDPRGLQTDRLFGFDGVWRTSTFRGNKNLLLGAWTARSNSNAAAGSPEGWGLSAYYPNDLWDCNASVNQYGEQLDPALGFLPRPGTRQTHAECNWQPRPSKDGPLRWIRQDFFENAYSRVTNLSGVVESWRYFMAPVNVRMETGDRFEFNWYPHYEFLAAPFEVAPGVVIPPGGYNFTRWRVEAQTSPHRIVQFGTTTWFGTFYNGDLTQQENFLRFALPGARFQLDLSTENDFAHMPSGNFVQRLWQARGTYAWNPNLSLTSFIQYDTESHNVGANPRLRWTIRPGNDLFVVWNRGWQKLALRPHDLNLVPQSDLVAIKLRWTFRR